MGCAGTYCGGPKGGPLRDPKWVPVARNSLSLDRSQIGGMPRLISIPIVLNQPRFSVGSFGLTLVPAVEPSLAKPLRVKEKRPTFCR